MCGRYDLSETSANLGSRFRVAAGSLVYEANADVRPTTSNPVIVERDGARSIELMRWGLVPSWAKEPKAITHCFNARSETAHEKPMFRGAFRSKRCLVPASAFFEWVAVPGMAKKVKHRISRSDAEHLVLAGLWEYWRRGSDEIKSFTILTTTPNEVMSPIHDRMPVILAESEWDDWLAPATSVDALRAMCMPCPSEWLVAASD